MNPLHSESTCRQAIIRGAVVLLFLSIGGCALIEDFLRENRAPVEERSTKPPPVAVKKKPAKRVQPQEDKVVVRRLKTGSDVGWQPIEQEPQAGPPQQSVKAPAEELNPAVIALLNKANRQARSGELDQSGLSIERALRIEPENAWLWHRLALIRLFQDREGEAESLAKRSNNLANGNRQLQADNWRLIAQAREKRGEPAAAKSAAKMAWKYSQ